MQLKEVSYNAVPSLTVIKLHPTTLCCQIWVNEIVEIVTNFLFKLESKNFKVVWEFSECVYV